MVSVRSVLRGLCAAALVVGFAACSSAGRNATRDGGGDRGEVSLIAGDLRFDPIESQPLPPGACGMFLWARSGEQPILLVAAFANPAEARVRLSGRNRTLRRSSADGASRYGHFETQAFEDDRLTLEVEVAFDEDRPMTDGVALESGVVRVRDREGWETVIPVGGLIGCGV
jgi:hypothetical protein